MGVGMDATVFSYYSWATIPLGNLLYFWWIPTVYFIQAWLAYIFKISNINTLSTPTFKTT